MYSNKGSNEEDGMKEKLKSEGRTAPLKTRIVKTKTACYGEWRT